jgi:WD40 repeat protein
MWRWSRGFRRIATLHSTAPAGFGVAVDAMGRRVAVVHGATGDIELWSMQTHRLLGTLPPLRPGPAKVVFEPGADVLATEGQGSSRSVATVQLWDLGTHHVLRTLRPPHAAELTRAGGIDFSSDGSLLLMDAASFTTVRLVAWDTRTGTVRDDQRLSWPASEAATSSGPPPIALAPDGHTVILGGPGRSLTVLRCGARYNGCRRDRSPPLAAGLGGTVTEVAAAPAGSLIASATNDGDVELADYTSGDRLASLSVNGFGRPSALAFAPGQSTLAVGTDAGYLIALATDPARAASALCAIVHRDLTPDEWRAYAPGRPRVRVCG